MKALTYDSYYEPIYKDDRLALKNGDEVTVEGVTKHGLILAVTDEGFRYTQLEPMAAIKINKNSEPPEINEESDEDDWE